MIDLYDAALDYLALGMSCIALSGKAPNGAVHRNGLKDAFSSPLERSAVVLAAFDHPKTTGVGILTSGNRFVIDIDGEEGAQQWKEIAGEDWLPDRWVAKSGRGLHLWFADVAPRTTRKLGPKLDLKAAGGYVVAPPSAHPDGGRYEWLLAPDGPVMEAPDSLRDLLDTQDLAGRIRQDTAAKYDAIRPVAHEPVPGWFFPSYGNHDGIIANMAAAPAGDRNNLLNWSAYTMAQQGAEEEDFQRLYDAAIEAGLAPREARLTIRSGWKGNR